MITKQIAIRPTNEIVIIIYSKDRKKVVDYLSKKHDINIKENFNYLDGSQTTITDHKTGEVYIYVILFDKAPQVIAHEIVHLIWDLSRESGIEINSNSEEWQAYLMGYLMAEILDFDSYKRLK